MVNRHKEVYVAMLSKVDTYLFLNSLRNMKNAATALKGGQGGEREFKLLVDEIEAMQTVLMRDYGATSSEYERNRRPNA